MKLAVIDIDQTMFHTETVVRVIRWNTVVRHLSSAEFNSYHLQDGEEFDFSDFRSAETFNRTAQPIYKVHDLARVLNMDHVIVYLTARGMVDDTLLFLEPFYRYKAPIAPVLFSGEFDHSPVENKRLVLRNLLKLTGCKEMVMVDDHHKHLQMAKGLEQEFTGLRVATFLVQNDTPLPYNGMTHVE